MRQLNEEYNALLAEKRSVYPEYLQARDEMRELLAVKANVDRILQQENEEIQRAPTKREQDR